MLVHSCLGGKNSNAYHDKTLRSKVYIDIYAQLRREFGYSGSYKAIKRKYISAAYDLINNYKLPATLSEQISNANAQQNLF